MGESARVGDGHGFEWPPFEVECLAPLHHWHFCKVISFEPGPVIHVDVDFGSELLVQPTAVILLLAANGT
jgi:hypothetical protein